jgi:hypothetical protein
MIIGLLLLVLLVLAAPYLVVGYQMARAFWVAHFGKITLAYFSLAFIYHAVAVGFG